MSTPANGGPASVRRVVMTAAAVAAVLTLGLILYILVVPTRPRSCSAGTCSSSAPSASSSRSASSPRAIPCSGDHPPTAPKTNPTSTSCRSGYEPSTALSLVLVGMPRVSELELRPILRAIAAQRLATYRTIDIDADPAAARAILGERVWTLLTPVNLEMARRARGIDPDGVRAAVEKLEELGASTHA